MDNKSNSASKKRLPFFDKFITRNFQPLIDKTSLTVIDRFFSPEFGGNECMILEGPNVFLKLIKDRDQLFAEFKSVGEKEELWFSIHHIRKTFNPGKKYSGLLDNSNLSFLINHFEEINSKFSFENYPAIKNDLIRIQEQMNIERWGKPDSKSSPDEINMKHLLIILVGVVLLSLAIKAVSIFIYH